MHSMNWPTAHIPTLDTKDLIGTCDAYLGSRTGKYEWRAQRYRAALDAITENGLTDDDTLFDIGAGWTEFDYCLRAEYNSRCRYIPVDGAIDGTDLQEWTPPRKAEWFVALELLEHLDYPGYLIERMQAKATKGIVISTPNPRTTDVLSMDPTHKVECHAWWLEAWGFTATESSFYGQPNDSILGVWLP